MTTRRKQTRPQRCGAGNRPTEMTSSMCINDNTNTDEIDDDKPPNASGCTAPSDGGATLDVPSADDDESQMSIEDAGRKVASPLDRLDAKIRSDITVDFRFNRQNSEADQRDTSSSSSSAYEDDRAKQETHERIRSTAGSSRMTSPVATPESRRRDVTCVVNGHVTRLREFVDSVRDDVTPHARRSAFDVATVVSDPTTVSVDPGMSSLLPVTSTPNCPSSSETVGDRRMTSRRPPTLGIVNDEDEPLDLSTTDRASSRTSDDDAESAVDCSDVDLAKDPPRQRASGGPVPMTSSSLAKLVKRFGGKTPPPPPPPPTMLNLDGLFGTSTDGRVEVRSSSPADVSHVIGQQMALQSTSSSSCRWRRDSFWSTGKWLPYKYWMNTVVADTVPRSWVTSSGTETTTRKRQGQPEIARKTGAAKQRRTGDDRHRTTSGSSSQIQASDRKLFADNNSTTTSRSTNSNGAHRDPKAEVSKNNVESRTSPTSESNETDQAATARRKLNPSVDADAKQSSKRPLDRRHSANRDGSRIADWTTETGGSSTSDDHSRRCLTSLHCGGCSLTFDSLFYLTVHLEETGHLPASDVVEATSVPTSAASESVDIGGTASPATSTTPHRLVRGQDVWLARGVEQTDRILRCMQCGSTARSLAELTLHMVHTKHYVSIVGPNVPPPPAQPLPPETRRQIPPTTSTSCEVVSGSAHPGALCLPTKQSGTLWFSNDFGGDCDSHRKSKNCVEDRKADRDPENRKRRNADRGRGQRDGAFSVRNLIDCPDDDVDVEDDEDDGIAVSGLQLGGGASLDCVDGAVHKRAPAIDRRNGVASNGCDVTGSARVNFVKPFDTFGRPAHVI